MAWDAYEVMPWRLGWKHEYCDGQALLTPRHQSVFTVVKITARTVAATPLAIRPVRSADVEGLKRLFFEVFHDSVEYCNYEAAEIRKSAARCIDEYFDRTHRVPSAASQVAIAPNHRLIGVALIQEETGYDPFLRLLGIHPTWQRQGLGTALVATALNSLTSTHYRQLESRYFLANPCSRQWHHRFGFHDQPDLWVMRVYYRHAQHELYRHERLGHLSPAEVTAVEAELHHWQAEVERLEALSVDTWALSDRRKRS